MSNPVSSDRQALLKTLSRAIYENSSMAVFFHTAIAEQVGLGATDEKTLLMLSGGPLTAGEIAQQTGLTTASVTSLIDRLESKGFVRRVRDSHDRRRVIVEADEARLAELFGHIGAMAGTFSDLFDPYSDEQLALLIDFVTRASEYSRRAIAELRAREMPET